MTIRNRMYDVLRKIIINASQLASGLIVHIFPNLFTRPSTKFVQKQGKKDMTVLEIGTDRGYNAKTILKSLDVKKIYLVDPYMEDPNESNFSLARTGSSAAFTQAQRELKPFKDKIEFILKTSEEAKDHVPDNLDFIYIDAQHTYEPVKKELETYYPKLKKGGIIAGHDWYADFIGVAKAVVEFANKNNLEIHGEDVDWWIVKK